MRQFLRFITLSLLGFALFQALNGQINSAITVGLSAVVLDTVASFSGQKTKKLKPEQPTAGVLDDQKYAEKDYVEARLNKLQKDEEELLEFKQSLKVQLDEFSRR